MEFWKMNGAGNDFILLQDWEGTLPRDTLPALAARVCTRRLSLGADGLMVVVPPEEDGDFRMLFYNSDGSIGEMCGNGARCICRYAWETGLAGEIQRVETTAGIVIGYRAGPRSWRIRLNDPSIMEPEHPLLLGQTLLPAAYMELGNPGIPHAVVSLSDLGDPAETQLLEFGRRIRQYPDFPKGANVNFYRHTGPGKIFVQTYERGVEDFTYACGTGVGSTVLALTLRGELDGSAAVDTRGGTLQVDVERDGKQIRNLWLTGPTNIVAKGELTDEELPKV